MTVKHVVIGGVVVAVLAAYLILTAKNAPSKETVTPPVAPSNEPATPAAPAEPAEPPAEPTPAATIDALEEVHNGKET